MLIINSAESSEFLAGDHTLLREVLHPDNNGVDLPFSLALARIPEGKSSLPHILKSTEVYIFMAGNGQFYFDDTPKPIGGGDIVVVNPGCNQYVKNTGTGDLTFYCIVSPKWQPEDEVILTV
ncbi:MAG: cupin domain-containing protein [Bacteroidota bacterium]